MKLYDVPMSPNARKVRAVADELGIELEMVPVDMAKGQHRSPEFKALNPNSKVPVLVDGDFVLWESNAIVTYFASLHPEAGLLPSDPRGRADVDRWLHWQSAHLAPAVGKVVYERVIKAMFGAPPEQAVVEAGLTEFARFGPVLESSLQGREWICGRLSVADFSLASTIDSADFAKMDLGPYPNMRAWLGRMRERKSWAGSMPKFG